MKNGKSATLVQPTALRYVGNGAALLDVPARDLSADEVAPFDISVLLASGLYIVDDRPALAAPAAPDAPQAPQE